MYRVSGSFNIASKHRYKFYVQESRKGASDLKRSPNVESFSYDKVTEARSFGALYNKKPELWHYGEKALFLCTSRQWSFVVC